MFIYCNWWDSVHYNNCDIKNQKIIICFIRLVSLSRSNCQEVNQSLPAVDNNDVKTAQTRIIGGTDAAPGEYPAMVCSFIYFYYKKIRSALFYFMT